MADYRREVVRLLKDSNCYVVRQGKGDHEIWCSPITRRHFPVDSEIKSRHTANAILKQAGLPKHFPDYPVGSAGICTTFPSPREGGEKVARSAG